MKKFVGFYYRCSFKVLLCAVLSLIALTVLSSSAFAQCTQYTPCTYGDYKYMVSNGTVTITQYIGAGGNVVVPSNINSMPVVGIDGYYEIDNYGYWYYGAFEGRNNVTSITIPNSVTSIGNKAFTYCSSLASIIVAANNTAYSSQDGVLYNKTMTMLIQYPGGKSGGFTIPDSVTTVGYQAFSGCSRLTSVTIPDSVTNIWKEAFYGCSGLTSVTIGNSVTSIGDYAFYDCSGLTSVTIGNSVTSIGNYVFEYCTSLTSVTIPASVTSIGGISFYYCSSLTSIVVDTGNTVYSSQDGVLYNKAKTVLIQCPGGKSGGLTIPDSVTSIGYNAFFYCSGLTSVTIGNSVTSIAMQAFYNCRSLTNVTIPASVTSIGSSAFAYCRGLTTAYFNGNAPSMGQAVFSVCASNFSICYTEGSTGFTTPKWNGYPAAVCGATLIELASFTATPEAGKVILQWSTETEIDNAGFNLYRSESENGENTQINTSLIPAQGSPTQGASYEFVDTNVQNRKTYYYRLEDIDLNGNSTMHGPVSATPRLIYGIGK